MEGKGKRKGMRGLNDDDIGQVVLVGGLQVDETVFWVFSRGRESSELMFICWLHVDSGICCTCIC